ncbi:MAG: SulP family inorganic anion transporter [Myxococcota bacterium]
MNNAKPNRASFDRFLAFRDLSTLSLREGRSDLQAAVALVFLSVPQGIAYALIAGLPPAMGLYAAAIPTVVGSLLRSSRHVITGPTNALSLLVGGAIAKYSGAADPLTIAITLAAVTGIMQALAGILRLSAIIDFISSPVVLGYITGAGVLIGFAQLKNATGTEAATGNLLVIAKSWWEGLHGGASVNGIAATLAVGTVILIAVLRRINPNIPGAVVAMLLGIVLSWTFGLTELGVMTIRDISSVPSGFPPFTVPDWSLVSELMPMAIACLIVSSVESSAVARSIAQQTGQRLDMRVELTGQGLANVFAGFTAGFVTSGSLTRSILNHRTGAQSRLAGALSGVLMFTVLFGLGPLVDYTPIASLAGLLFVVAKDLVDIPRIARTLRSTRADAIAFSATALATWLLSLDQAILLGVGISIALYLRSARLMHAGELVFDSNGLPQEFPVTETPESRRCRGLRVLHIEGALFFGAASEFQSLLDDVTSEPGVRAVVLRLKRAQDIDMSSAEVIAGSAQGFLERGGRLYLAGVKPRAYALLERTGVIDVLGKERVFPAEDEWYVSLRAAIRVALDELPPDACTPETCPMHAMLRGYPEDSALAEIGAISPAGAVPRDEAS